MTSVPTATADELCWLSAADTAREVRAGRLSPIDIAEAAVHRIERIDPELNALVSFDREQVLRDAAELERAQRDREPLGPLHGVGFTIKDLTAVAGLPLTFGLRPLAEEHCAHDAVAVERLRRAGGLFLGKTNTPEAGYYGGTDNHLFGPTHNPWKPGCTAGGSSGGAAAAVAAGLGQLAEGSDGAGSVRIPSSLCGVVGLKPSPGRIPQTILPARYATWAYHGPITRTVADNALMLDVLSGPHPADPLSLPTPPAHFSFSATLRGDVRGWRVAWSPDLGFAEVAPEVTEVCRQAVQVFAELGAVVEEATPALGDPEEAMWHGIWVPGYGAERDLLDWDSLRGQVDDELLELFAEGDRVSATDVGRAEAFRGRMWDVFTAFMAEYDLLVTPTLCEATFPLDRFAPLSLDGQSLRRRLLGWLLTYPFNMLTTPAITVPAGFTADGRPVGLQLCATQHREDTLLRAAACFEAAQPWQQHRPGDDF
ncbi:amidase [Saccharopolyspora sp. HNM0983]|uniref:Amidase n=1 Tax=Saccharopolyspora montiporae TaxID=2781240 RepID=A0A929FWR6_9PSEU|nr:amidase family protein [Saccharopolyspora sp. HNM0983]MBE9373836.1 amidase [Saccharopolyspora sp. HNM0983]